jgi:hypothetical protein
VVRASDSQCRSRDSPGFDDPSIHRHSGVRGPADETVLKVSLIATCAGVLPGLEEGSDHYQRTSSLLEAVVEAVNPFVFYSALWECVAANATVRQVEAFNQVLWIRYYLFWILP